MLISLFFSGAIDTCLALTFDLCAGTSSPSIILGSVDTALALLCLVTGFFNLSAMSVAKWCSSSFVITRFFLFDLLVGAASSCLASTWSAMAGRTTSSDRDLTLAFADGRGAAADGRGGAVDGGGRCASTDGSLAAADFFDGRTRCTLTGSGCSSSFATDFALDFDLAFGSSIARVTSGLFVSGDLFRDLERSFVLCGSASAL